jgi:hypothetical protein
VAQGEGPEFKLQTTKNHSKLVKDFNIRCELLKLVGENLWRYGRRLDFLNRTPISQEIKARIDTWYCIRLKKKKTKTCAQQKKTITRIKIQPTKWEIIFAGYSSDKEYIKNSKN